MTLFPNEAKLLELFRSLPSGGQNEVLDFAAFKASRTGQWSYDDEASCAAAWARATEDPAFVSEVQAIQREFSVTESDGLSEDY